MKYVVIAGHEDGPMVAGPGDLEWALRYAQNNAARGGAPYYIFKLVATHRIKPPIVIPPEVEEVP